MKWGSRTPILTVLLSSLVHGVAEAQSFVIEAELAVSGATRYEGTIEGEAILSGAIYDADEESKGLGVELTFDVAHVRVVNSPYAISGANPDRPDLWRIGLPLPSETLVDDDKARGSLKLIASMANATYRFLPQAYDERLRLPLEGQLDVKITPQTEWHPKIRGAAFAVDSRPLVPYGPAGSFEPSRANQSLEFMGSTYALLFGGTFIWENPNGETRTIVTGERLNSSMSAEDVTGTVGTWKYDRVVLLIEGEEVRTRLTSGDAGSLLFALESVQGEFTGDLAFSAVAGSMRVDGRDLPAERTLLQTIGAFQVQADYRDEGSSSWNLAGTATFVGVDGLPVAGNRHQGEWAAAAGVAGLSLLALMAAYLTHAGREFLTFISGRNVAKPLESAARLQFLREIAHQPGLTLKDLAARTGLTKWGALHHMAILKRARFVDEVRNGNVSTFMLNSHSYKFYVPALASRGAGGNPEKVFVAGALAELNHPNRRMIFEALQRTAPAHYAQLVDAWKQMGIAPPYPTPRDLTYHASKMEEAGLVWRRRDGPNVVWGLNLDVDALRQHQRRAYLRDPAAAAIVEVLRSRPALTLDQLLKEVSASSRLPSRDSIRQGLLSLEHVGVVRLEPNGLTYALVERAKLTAQST